MSIILRRVVMTLAFLSLVPGLGLAGGTEWPHLRGPDFDGEVAGTELFARGETALALAWRVPLGSGYSGISVAGGRAVTLYSDGESDWAVAVDARSGNELWRYRIDAANKGHDGSDDGPLSTPIIQDDVVYGLAAIEKERPHPATTPVAVEVVPFDLRDRRTPVDIPAGDRAPLAVPVCHHRHREAGCVARLRLEAHITLEERPPVVETSRVYIHSVAELQVTIVVDT